MAPPARTSIFADLVEDKPHGVTWHTAAETKKLLGMMNPLNLAKVEAAKKAGGRQVGTIYKRTRADGPHGEKVQRAEIRFDDVAGCLRTCRFQKTAALNVRSRLHYSSGGVGSIRQRRAAAGHQRTQGGLSATGRSMRHRWPSRRGSESARIDLRCPTSH